jgi:peptide deformylase
MGSMAGKRVESDKKGGLDVVMYPNPILLEVAKPIANITDEDRQLALLLENTMFRMDGQGLSAPQVGVSKRMSVVKLARPASDKETVVMINPEIIEQAGSSTAFEGCLSLPRGDREIEVTRSEEISVKYLTLEGKEVVLEETGANARVIQHEIDHLNGILIVDYHKGFTMTLPILLAIVVYSIAVCVAVFIFIFNRRKRKVSG